MTGATGPKISSVKAGIERVTPPSTVGWKNGSSCLPPVTSSAPCDTLSSTIRSTRSTCFWLMIGPSATSSVAGLPTGRCEARSASALT